MLYLNIFQMINTTLLMSCGIILFVFCFILNYGLQVRKPYPRDLMTSYSEALTRFVSYIIIYCISTYNAPVGLIMAIALLLMHLDYIVIFLPKSKP